MKKMIFMLLAIVAITSVQAQELTQRMFNIYNGNAKTLVEGYQGMEQKMTVQFDRQGRVLSKTDGVTKYVYNWASDGKSIDVKGYFNGQYQGAQPIYISEMSSSKYIYEIAGVTYTILFKSNGAINKMTASAGGQCMTTTYYYNDPNSQFPYKIVTSQDGQSMSTSISVISKDSKGNCTKNSQTVNGQSAINESAITYY